MRIVHVENRWHRKTIKRGKSDVRESFKSANAKFRFKRCTLNVCVAFQCVVNEINNKIEAVLSKELHRTFAMNLELLREYSFCAPVQRIISFLTFGVFWVIVVVCIVATSE